MFAVSPPLAASSMVPDLVHRDSTFVRRQMPRALVLPHDMHRLHELVRDTTHVC